MAQPPYICILQQQGLPAGWVKKRESVVDERTAAACRCVCEIAVSCVRFQHHPPRPPNTTQRPTESKSHPDRSYYFNTATGETTWDKPTAPAGVAGGGAAQVGRYVGPMGSVRVFRRSGSIGSRLTDQHASVHHLIGTRVAPAEEAPRLPPALLVAAGDHHLLQGGGRGRARGSVSACDAVCTYPSMGGTLCCVRPHVLTPPHHYPHNTALRDRIVAAGQAGGAEALRREFESLAQVESDCSSAAKGGSLGFFGRGQMQRPFEGACVVGW